jgi:ABC-type polysaccharide/polyol phosphate export permease
MAEALREILKHRELLYQIAWREIRVKYKQSVMGFLWAILMPVIITSAGLMVRIVLTKLSGKPLSGADVGTIAVKSLPWAFFVSALRFGTTSLVSNSALVTKIKFPRLVFPLSAVLSSLADLLVAAPVVILMLPLAGIGLSWTQLWVPVLLGVLIMFTVGVTVIASAANLFFRDVKYLVEVIMTFAIFFTPVLYDASMAGRYETILLLNPVAPVLEGLRAAVILGQQPDLGWLGYSAAIGLVACWGGISFFRRLEPRFAESV